MKNRIIIALTASSFVLTALGFTLAQAPATQDTQAAQTDETTQTDETVQTRNGLDIRGYGFGHGLGGFAFGRHLALGTLALGTTVEVTFYDGDPAAAGTVLETLNFTYGEDSEADFAQTFSAARADAAFMVVQVGAQTQTLELADVAADADGRNRFNGGLGRGFRGLSRGLSEGSSVEATFYDGDPAGDAQTLQTLTFTYGQDSEAGFAADFAAAAEAAAFVTVTTSPQTYTVDLSVESVGRHGGFRGGFRGSFGDGDDEQGRRGHRGGFGPGGSH